MLGERLICALLFLSLTFSVYAETSSESGYWLNLSPIGTAYASGDDGILNLSSLNVGVGDSFFTLRNLYYENTSAGDVFDALFECFTFISCDEKNVLSLEEWGVLYGREINSTNFVASLGIGKIVAQNSVDSSKDFETWSIPVEVSWSRKKGKWLDWTVKFAASLNKERPIFGIAVGFDIGKLSTQQ